MRKTKERQLATVIVAVLSTLCVLGTACHFDALFGSGPKGGGGGGSGGGGGGGGLGFRWQLESLEQRSSDLTTVIPTGGTAGEPSVVVRAVVRDTASSTLRLEVEVQPIGTAFVDQASDASDPTPSGMPTYVRVGGLADKAAYHWQARVVDETEASPWLPYGGNAENAPDLRVALPVATNHLMFTQQPSTTTAGDIMAPAVKVALQDRQGGTITSFTGTVYLKIAPGANPGGDNLAGSANAVAGVATFSDVRLTKAGNEYKLEATTDGVAPVTSASFGVKPGPWQYPKFLVQPSNTTPNQPIAPAVKVAVMDFWGNIVTSYPYTLYMQIANDGSPGHNATLDISGNGRAATAGIATFENLKIDQLGTGYTLYVAGTGVQREYSASFNVLPTLP